MSMVRSQKSIGRVVGVAVGNTPYKIGDHTEFTGDNAIASVIFPQLQLAANQIFK